MQFQDNWLNNFKILIVLIPNVTNYRIIIRFRSIFSSTERNRFNLNQEKLHEIIAILSFYNLLAKSKRKLFK